MVSDWKDSISRNMGPVAPTGHFPSNYKLSLAYFTFQLTSAGKWVKKNIMFQL